MRLLVDESLSARICEPLARAGHDVVHAADLGLLGDDDDAVLEAAVEHERILVTADTDFGTLLARSGAPMPSVVLLRRSGRRPAERTEQIVLALELAEDALAGGALVVSEATRLRVRPLPVQQTTDE